MTNKFKEDCIEAIKELEGVVKVLENQEKVSDTIENMGLTDEQKEILANLFLDKQK